LALAAGIQLNGRYLVEDGSAAAGWARLHALDTPAVVALKLITSARANDPDAEALTRSPGRLGAESSEYRQRVHAGECDTGPFIVMELIAGRTVRAALQSRPT
jgi:hypothetical protein